MSENQHHEHGHHHGHNHDQHFGSYSHIGKFLDHYKKSQNADRLNQIHTQHQGDVQGQIDSLRKPEPDVVEVEATIVKSNGDEHEHYQFYVNVTKQVTQSDDAEVNQDIANCIEHKLEVFLAVRYGDNEGLSQPIKSGDNVGDQLHIKGQWIPAERAHAQDGEKVSVLHFTHHPVGFICTTEQCYS
jgi:endonuclease G, mitochondrial